MPTFRDILTASDAELVKIFYRIKPAENADFLKQINNAARQLGLNHSQLVCALGFNTNARELTDILSVVGFSSYKLLTYRRNELFATDTYRHLDIDNVVDIYSEHIEDENILTTLRELIAPRLAKIEDKLAAGDEPAMMISYKMEVHSIYSGGIATPEFAAARFAAAIGNLRVMIGELQMVMAGELVPPGNLFYSDYLLPAEKRHLIKSGLINQAMIKNRLGNAEISEDERQVLEDFLE